eukprot:scaffold124126_cov16-Prasinocladus_malaysianus.AAC.2
MVDSPDTLQPDTIPRQEKNLTKSQQHIPSTRTYETYRPWLISTLEVDETECTFLSVTCENGYA